MQKITIIGGTDGFGKWLGNFILQNFKNNISLKITGRNIEKGNKVAEDLGCKFSNDNLESIKDADIVIFSVPIAFMEKTIEELAPHIKKGTLAVDICSIKIGPSNALKKFSPEGVMILPTHPMFGPYVATIAGQIFVLTPDEKDKDDFRYKFLKDFLEKSGAKVIESNPEEHDQMMAIVQGLTHFNMFAIGNTIREMGIDIEKSMDFVSPIYKLMITSVSRYVGHNPKLYGDIQMFNTKILPVHESFIKSTKKLNKFVENKDEEGFINEIMETQKYFGINSQRGQKYTDKIIYLISKQIEKLEGKIGEKIHLKNIYSEENFFGVLKNFSDHEIFFEDGNKVCLDEWEVL